MMESQSLGPDRLSPPARDARWRFASGSSGNPRGRPPGIPNPKRRVPNLVVRQLSAQALSRLLDRKPYLLRPLAAQLLPPPLRAIDPAERLGIELASLRTAEDVRKVFARVWTAISRGEIAPVEGARVARRLRARLRVLRRFARLGKSQAVFPADEKELAALEEFARGVGERLRPLGADGATGASCERTNLRRAVGVGLHRRREGRSGVGHRARSMSPPGLRPQRG
jgi:hypothetical protein